MGPLTLAFVFALLVLLAGVGIMVFFWGAHTEPDQEQGARVLEFKQ